MMRDEYERMIVEFASALDRGISVCGTRELEVLEGARHIGTVVSTEAEFAAAVRAHQELSPLRRL